MTVRLLTGDCRAVLATLPDASVQMCVTSPPYFGLRDYGVDQQIGLEPDVQTYVAKLVAVFREVRRVLRDDGCLFLNLGDSYASGKTENTNGTGGKSTLQYVSGGKEATYKTVGMQLGKREYGADLKPKDLIGVPWRVAFALQQPWLTCRGCGTENHLSQWASFPNGRRICPACELSKGHDISESGWYLRSDIIWAKPNPMPESVRDRPTKAHEYIFLLTKSSRYFWDAEAVREPHETKNLEYERNKMSKRMGVNPEYDRVNREYVPREGNGLYHPGGRNIRSVWQIATAPFSGASLLADYVGRDGKPYKVSPDCPVHGHLATRAVQRTGEYGERPDPQLPDTDGTDNRPVLEPHDGHGAIALSSSDTSLAGSTSERILQSTADHRTPYQSPCSVDGQADDDESLYRTSHNEALSRLPACTSDSLPHEDAPIATLSSTESHRTDLVPATSQPYIASAQSPARTDGRLGLPGFDGLAGHTTGSSISTDDSPAHPSARTRSRTADRSSSCNCTTVSVDHFATFPPALAERCIKAGTSQHGACRACGAPWVRTTERTFTAQQDVSAAKVAKASNKGMDASNGWGDVPRGTVDVTTIGWQPTCSCDGQWIEEEYWADDFLTRESGVNPTRQRWAPNDGEPSTPVPCVVLDPFGGAGTVSLVAERLGRDSIYIDLSSDYAAMAKKRIYDDAPLFANVDLA